MPLDLQHSLEGASVTELTLSYCNLSKYPLVLLLPEKVPLTPSLPPLCGLRPDHCPHVRCSVLHSTFLSLSVISLCLLKMRLCPQPL